MQALSLDLRERIVESYESGEGSYAAIAERFSVGPTVVGKFVRQKRDLGTLAPQVHAVALDGTRAAMVLDGPINSESFTGFCKWLLAPALQAGDWVVMDNLSSHKSAAAVEAIEAAGAKVVYLPPYSPDLNPIENIFSKIKQLIRGLKPRSLSSIVDAVQKVLPKITHDELRNTFLHCGYDVS